MIPPISYILASLAGSYFAKSNYVGENSVKREACWLSQAWSASVRRKTHLAWIVCTPQVGSRGYHPQRPGWRHLARCTVWSSCGQGERLPWVRVSRYVEQTRTWLGNEMVEDDIMSVGCVSCFYSILFYLQREKSNRENAKAWFVIRKSMLLWLSHGTVPVIVITKYGRDDA